MIIDYVAVGLRIKKARKKADMSQEELANKADLSTHFISNIENGSRKMSLETLVGIANALSVSADDLLCDNLVHSFHVYNKEAQELYADCSTEESRVLVDITEAGKSALRKNQQLWERILTRKDD